MTGHTHSPAEWAQMVCLSLAIFEACSVPFFLLVDADASDFDPRPVVRRLVDAGRVDGLLVRVANARFDVREAVAEARLYAALSLRDAAITATALLALLVPAPSESAR